MCESCRKYEAELAALKQRADSAAAQIAELKKLLGAVLDTANSNLKTSAAEKEKLDGELAALLEEVKQAENSALAEQVLAEEGIPVPGAAAEVVGGENGQ